MTKEHHPHDALFTSSALSFHVEDLKSWMSLSKGLQRLLLSRAGLLNHETRVTTSSSLPRAANQELGISWSECQTSLAPSKSTRTIPHSSSNEVLCWTPRLFEYCTQVCSHWALRRSLLELWPRAVVLQRCVIDCSMGSCDYWTQWDEKEPSTLTHLWRTFALSITQPQPKALKGFLSLLRYFEEDPETARSWAHAGVCSTPHAETSSPWGATRY